MKIRLLKDHMGRETNEIRYFSGDVVELDDANAMILVSNGWAEIVPDKEEIEMPGTIEAKPEVKQVRRTKNNPARNKQL